MVALCKFFMTKTPLLIWQAELTITKICAYLLVHSHGCQINVGKWKRSPNVLRYEIVVQTLDAI